MLPWIENPKAMYKISSHAIRKSNTIFLFPIVLDPPSICWFQSRVDQVAISVAPFLPEDCPAVLNCHLYAGLESFAISIERLALPTCLARLPGISPAAAS